MKQIIILDTTPSDGGKVRVRAVFWFPVPAENALPLPNLSQSIWNGASPDEIAELQAGTVIEEVETQLFPTAATVEQVQDMLVSLYAARSAFLAQVPFKDGVWSTK